MLDLTDQRCLLALDRGDEIQMAGMPMMWTRVVPGVQEATVERAVMPRRRSTASRSALRGPDQDIHSTNTHTFDGGDRRLNPRDPRDQHTARYEPGYDAGNYREPGYGRDRGYDAYQQPEYGYQQPEYPNRQPEHPGGQPEYPDRRPRQQRGPELDPGKFIGGVLAAAVVTALAAWLCAWIIEVISTRVTQSGRFGVWNPMAEDAYWFAVVAFLCAVLAGGLWYLLRLGTPTPGLFFVWIVGILTAAAVIIPVALSSDLWVGISTGIEHLVIGLPILSLVRMVGARSVVYR